jgi:small subunit ribosomal protein S1
MLTVGDNIQVKVLKFDKEKERVSLGMKQLTEDPWEGVPARYPLSARVSGKVMSVTDYGAFIKLEDGVEGLVHISEMTWNRKIKHPSKIVEVGDSVEAEVLSIDTENRRISLGMKQIEPNPWDIVAEHYPIGSIIEGKVRTLTDFGAFIGLEEGIDGLIHVSDMSWTQKINHPSEIIKKGDSVKAVVLSVDKGRERLSLGLKQLTTNPWEELASKHPAGSVIIGKVVNHADFGTFVELMEGVEGLIHVSEMDVDNGQNPEEAYPSGKEVTVKILNIDSEERKVSLSMKAAKEGSSAPPYKSYLNNDSGGGTLGDILGASLAAVKDSEEPSSEEVEAAPEEDVEASAPEVEEEVQAEPVEAEAAEEAADEQEEDVETSTPEVEEEVQAEPVETEAAEEAVDEQEEDVEASAPEVEEEDQAETEEAEAVETEAAEEEETPEEADAEEEKTD